MRVLGSNPTKAQIEDIIKDLNTDGEGTIDFFEFLSIIGRMIKDDDFENELIESFRSYDKNGTGVLTIEDFRKSLLKFEIPVEEIDEII